MVQLLCGDCLEQMADIPAHSIDLILCDLPYGTTCNSWDVPLPLPALWAHYSRLIKDHAAIVLFSQMPFTVDLVQSNRALFRYEWIWEKNAPTGFLNARKMPMKAHENILVFYTTYNPQFQYKMPYIRQSGRHDSTNYGKRLSYGTVSLDGRRFPRDCLTFPNAKQRGLHPTQKPVALLQYLICTYTNPGDTVLDNCMGSGSTGVACVQTDRNFIGIEIQADYFFLAQQRIRQVQKKNRAMDSTDSTGSGYSRPPCLP